VPSAPEQYNLCDMRRQLLPCHLRDPVLGRIHQRKILRSHDPLQYLKDGIAGVERGFAFDANRRPLHSPDDFSKKWAPAIAKGSGISLALAQSVTKRMDAGRTKLAVRVAVVGFRDAKATAKRVGGSHGQEIEQGAKSRAHEILDQIENEGTNADEEKQAARREVDGGGGSGPS